MTVSNFPSDCHADRWRRIAAHLAATRPTYTSHRGATLYCRAPVLFPDRPAHSLRSGDVVYFRFPHLDCPDELVTGLMPVARPGLVVEVDAIAETALIAYGTSRTTRANTGCEIRVKHELFECGLTRRTRFVLARRIRVSLRDPRFNARKGGTPITGHLPARQLERLARLRAFLRAIHDGDEALRHVHEWVGANALEDRLLIAALLQECQPQVA